MTSNRTQTASGSAPRAAGRLITLAARRLASEREELPRRLVRARMTGLPLPVRVLLGSGSVAGLAVAVLYALLPQKAPMVPALSQLLWAVTMVGFALVVAFGVLWAAGPRSRIVPLVAAALAAVLPVALLTAQRVQPLVPAVCTCAAIMLAAAAAAAAVLTARPTSGLRRWAVSVLVAAAGVLWLVLALQPLVMPFPFGALPQQLLLSFPVVAAVSLVGLHLLAVLGVAAAARGRHAATIGRLRGDLRPLWAWLAVGAALFVVLLRLTVLRDAFGATDGMLWTVRTWTTWPLAVAVGVLLVALVLRSERRPQGRQGQRSLTAGLVVGVLAQDLALLALVVQTTIDTAAGRHTDGALLLAVGPRVVAVCGVGRSSVTGRWSRRVTRMCSSTRRAARRG